MTRDIYSYANNNPLNSSDPLGLIASTLTGADVRQISSASCREALAATGDSGVTGPSPYLSISGTLCLIVCVGGSVNWGAGGIYVGITKGIGPRAEAGIGIAPGWGTLGGKDNISVECAGLWGGGYFGGVYLPANGSEQFLPTGAYAGVGGGFGGGCSLNFTDYNKIF